MTESLQCPCRPGGSFRRAIRADIARYVYLYDPRARGLPAPVVAKAFVLCGGLSAVLLYRLSHLVVTRLPAVRWLAALLARISEHLFGVVVEPTCHARPGLLINHIGTVYLGAREIGANCNISHGVTMGRATTERSGPPQVPTLGDRVWVGPHAVITGDVRLGDDCVVGPNAVVVKSVPPGAIVLGSPAAVVGWAGSFSRVGYQGVDDDPERAAAMARVRDVARDQARERSRRRRVARGAGQPVMPTVTGRWPAPDHPGRTGAGPG